MTQAEHTIDDSIDHLLVISDIHGFKRPLDAFDKIRETYADSYQIICNGDLCCGGLDVPYVLDWLKSNVGQLSTLGNHDDCLLQGGDPNSLPGKEAYDFLQLNQSQLDYLGNMPHSLQLKWRGHDIHLTHGHITRDEGTGSWRATPDEQIASLADPDADLCISSHTHFSFIDHGKSGIYANTGSLAATINGIREKGVVHYQCGDREIGDKEDRRPSFLDVTCEDGKLNVAIIRLEYDHQAAAQELEDGGHHDPDVYRNWLAEGIYTISTS
ncbi:metallophosphoesterase [bacterium AH-315-E10]|nr:metallophosphoesterase [bacterium AH-315-E10]